MNMKSFIVKVVIIGLTYFLFARPFISSMESGAHQDIAILGFGALMMILLNVWEERKKTKTK